eukprot:6211034-Pleurochrysis_carterae.AAC.3
MHVHARTHARAHARTHARTHAHTSSQLRTLPSFAASRRSLRIVSFSPIQLARRADEGCSDGARDSRRGQIRRRAPQLHGATSMHGFLNAFLAYIASLELVRIAGSASHSPFRALLIQYSRPKEIEQL